MIGDNTISVITRFRDREEFLKQTLPTWLFLKEIDQVLIIDWDSKQNQIEHYLYTLPKNLQWKIKLIKVYNQPEFNRSASWNWGILQATTDWVMLLDCDIKLIENPFKNLKLHVSKFFHPGLLHDAEGYRIFGSFLVAKETMIEIGGYNESFVGWGYEDADVFERLKDKGVKEVSLKTDYFYHIKHNDELRTTNHKEQDIILSRNKNIFRSLNVNNIKFKTEKIGEIYELGKRTAPITTALQVIEWKIPKLQMELIINSDEFAEEFCDSNEFEKDLKKSKFNIFVHRPDYAIHIIEGIKG